jgi:hypothetical protein
MRYLFLSISQKNAMTAKRPKISSVEPSVVVAAEVTAGVARVAAVDVLPHPPPQLPPLDIDGVVFVLLAVLGAVTGAEPVAEFADSVPGAGVERTGFIKIPAGVPTLTSRAPEGLAVLRPLRIATFKASR